MVPSAAVRLEGAPNFRDLAGIRVGASSIRPGIVYRSEGLAALSDADVQIVRDLRIAAAFDLRSAGERDSAPSRWPPDATPEIVCAAEPHTPHTTLRAQIEAALDSPGDVRAVMLETYRALPVASAGPLRGVADAVLAGRFPVLVHCTAGKDRTGFLCAVLLLAIGARYADVERDYLRSDDGFGAQRLDDAIFEAFGRRAELAALRALGVDRSYLLAALQEMAREHRTLDRYLEVAAGLDAERRARLRHALVV